jgi:hypothetical protein
MITVTDTAECMVLLVGECDVTYHLHAQFTIHSASSTMSKFIPVTYETTYLLI